MDLVVVLVVVVLVVVVGPATRLEPSDTGRILEPSRFGWPRAAAALTIVPVVVLVEVLAPVLSASAFGVAVAVVVVVEVLKRLAIGGARYAGGAIHGGELLP